MLERIPVKKVLGTKPKVITAANQKKETWNENTIDQVVIGFSFESEWLSWVNLLQLERLSNEP